MPRVLHVSHLSPFLFVLCIDSWNVPQPSSAKACTYSSYLYRSRKTAEIVSLENATKMVNFEWPRYESIGMQIFTNNWAFVSRSFAPFTFLVFCFLVLLYPHSVPFIHLHLLSFFNADACQLTSNITKPSSPLSNQPEVSSLIFHPKYLHKVTPYYI